MCVCLSCVCVFIMCVCVCLSCVCVYHVHVCVRIMAVVGLMDRALDLNPKVVGSNPGSDRKSTVVHSRLPTDKH